MDNPMELFKLADTDQDGKISYEDLVGVLGEACDLDQLGQVFESFGPNDDGLVTLESYAKATQGALGDEDGDGKEEEGPVPATAAGTRSLRPLASAIDVTASLKGDYMYDVYPPQPSFGLRTLSSPAAAGRTIRGVGRGVGGAAAAARRAAERRGRHAKDDMAVLGRSQGNSRAGTDNFSGGLRTTSSSSSRTTGIRIRELEQANAQLKEQATEAAHEQEYLTVQLEEARIHSEEADEKVKLLEATLTCMQRLHDATKACEQMSAGRDADRQLTAALALDEKGREHFGERAWSRAGGALAEALVSEADTALRAERARGAQDARAAGAVAARRSAPPMEPAQRSSQPAVVAKTLRASSRRRASADLRGQSEWGDITAVIASLKDPNADVHWRDEENQQTALHAAALYNCDNSAVVRELVAHGADVNARDVRGCTPLALATRMRHHKTAETLRSLGGSE